MLSEVNQVLMHATDEDRLVHEVCRVIVEIGGYPLAWAGFIEHDEAKSLRHVASSGRGEEQLQLSGLNWSDAAAAGPIVQCVESRSPVSVTSLQSDPRTEEWRLAATELGFDSCISLPITAEGGDVFGVLVLFSEKSGSFAEPETVLLTELAGDLSFGINALRSRTARLSAEAEAREAANYARSLVEVNVNPLALFDTEGRIVDVNKATEEAVGLPREQLIGTMFTDYFVDPEAALRGLQKALDEGVLRDYPLEMKGADGATVSAECNASVYRDASGEVKGVFCSLVDVTGRKEAQEQAARLAAIVTSSRDAIFSKDLQGRILSWNAAAQDFYGYSAEEVLGQSVEVLTPPERKGEPEHLTARVLAGERIDGHETQRMRKDGTLLDVSLTLSPICDERGDVTRISVIAQDITERKRSDSERAAHLRFMEAMDLVNRAIQGSDDLNQMADDVLGIILEVMNADRAFLVYPCDPDASSWGAPMECTRPAFPGIKELGGELPVDEDVAATFRVLLEADGPVAFGPGTQHPLPEDVKAEFGFKSFMSMALRPKTGRPWQLGVHQCTYPRFWTDEEARLLKEMGRRLNDALSLMLAHRELERSEAAYSALLNTASEGVWALDGSMQTTYVNPRMAEMLGYSVEEITAAKATEFMFEEDLADHNARIRERHTGVPGEYERRWRRKDGSTLWTHMSAAPIFEDGEMVGTFAMITDITERKRAQEELAQSEQKFASAFRASPDIISITRMSDGKIVDVNDGYEQMMGYTREESLGKTTVELEIWRDAEDRALFLGTIRDKGEIHNLETQLRRKDGSFVDVLMSARKIVLRDEECVLSIVRDITERRHNEAIREARLRLEQFANDAHSVRELLIATLDEVEILTESCISFYHFVDPDEQSITLQAWSTNTVKNMCKAEGVGSHYAIADAGVWTEALRVRRPVIHNDYDSLPNKHGMPEGHAPVVREVVVPVFRSNHIVAMFGVGNKETDYTEEDLRTVELFADYAWDIAERKRVEQSLRESEEKYRTLLQKIQAAVVVHAPDSSILTCNSMAQEILGQSEDQLLGRVAPDEGWHFMREDGSEMPLDEYPVQQVLATGKSLENYVMGVHRPGHDQTDGWALVNAVPVRNTNGTLTEVIVTFVDITARKRAEESLRQITQMLHIVLDHMPAFVFWKDIDSVYLGCNYLFASNAGLEHTDDIVGRTDLDLPWSREEAESYRADDRLVMDSGVPKLNYEETQHTADGRLTWVRTSKVPLKDAAGRVIGILGTFEDFTERKLAEEALTESEQRYRDIFDHSTDSMFLLEVTEDMHFRTLDVNPAFEESTGVAREQVVGKLQEELTSPEQVAAVNEPYRRVVEGGETRRGEIDLQLPAGRRYYSSSLIPLRDESGRIDRILGINHDITERRLAEEALRDTERKLALHLEQTLLGVIEWDNQLRIREWNPAAEAMFGYTRSEAVGNSIVDMVFAPDRRADAKPSFERLLIGEGERFATSESMGRDGHPIQCEWVHTPLADDEGSVAGVMSLARDVTERRQADELRIQKSAAESANIAKSAFLANMSHEIRTPMNAILGFSQLMRHDKALTDRQRQQLDIINSSGEHLLMLINDILEMSKIEAGRISANPSAFDLQALLDDIGSMFELRAETKGLHLTLDRAPELPRFVVTDENKLRQVLVNLLGNAVKFTEEGGITLRAGVHDDAEKKRLIFEVQDTGRGIEGKDMPRLFEYFEQVGSTRETEQGTGLGLAISREFVRLLGGEISVESQIGSGSTFRFDVAIELADAEAAEAKRNESRVVGLAPGQPHYRVLIADDAPDNRELLLQLLQPVGFLVRSVSNGKEALEEFESWRPQLILMDMRMPVLDGYEATRRIRRASFGSDVAIIGVTASAFSEMRQGVFDAGVDEFVGKPFHESELFEKIGKLLNLRFVYETPTGATLEEDAVLPETLSTLPEDIVARLRDAATAADFDTVVELAREIEGSDKNLAEALRTLAERFDAEAILKSLSRGGA